MKFLSKAASAALKPKKSVISVLVKNLSGFKPERSHHNVHASDITKPDFCPRRRALLTLHGKTAAGGYINAALQATFDVGNSTGDLVREQWAGESSVGDWKCLSCGTRKMFTNRPSVDGCPANEKHIWSYREVGFVCKKTGVSGSIDMFIDLGAPKLLIVELKIMRPDEFEKIVAPLAEHKLRTNLYMHLVANSSHVNKDRINTLEAKVLYVSRGFGKKNEEHGEILPFREFDVKRDDTVLLPYLEKAQMVQDFKTAGIIPAMRVCPTGNCTQAKKCEVSAECWGGSPLLDLEGCA